MTTTTNTPQPNRPVRGSTSGEPIMALLDLLGRRWALRIIWELRTNALTFREVQLRCGRISSSVLNDRLHELRAASIIEQRHNGYAITEEGCRLLDLYPPIQDWAERWAQRHTGTAPRAAVSHLG